MDEIEKPHKSPPEKNIVICCDGTGKEFGDDNSNIVKLYSILNRHPSEQIAYYHPGLGTAGELDWLPVWGVVSRGIKILLGKALGYGLLHDIAGAYGFLMEHYNPGDKIFVFGFSRGSYTARALCSMLREFGLMDKGCEVQIPYAVKLFKKAGKGRFGLAQEFKETYPRRPPKIPQSWPLENPPSRCVAAA